MDIWDVISYGAWAAAGFLLFWMVADAFRVGREYDENILLSSREGSDELLEREAHHSR